MVLLDEEDVVDVEDDVTDEVEEDAVLELGGSAVEELHPAMAPTTIAPTPPVTHARTDITCLLHQREAATTPPVATHSAYESKAPRQLNRIK